MTNANPFQDRARSALGGLQRARLDGRLPEATSHLLRRLAALRARAAVETLVAAALPPLGWRPGARNALPTERCGHRRWQTAGPLRRSLFRQAHLDTQDIVAALTRAGAAPFVTGPEGGGWELGVAVDQRAAAVVALEGLDPGAAWHLRWRRGPRSGVVRVGGRSLPRPARRAERWTLFRPRSIAPALVTGPEEGTVVTFWAPGRAGQLERLGVRGANRLDPRAATTTELVDGHDLPGRATFAVARSLRAHRFPIDVVYTWVDGSDPAWRAEYDRWVRAEQPEHRRDHAAHPSRYADHDELRYSLRSLWLHADWVRHVFVLTAGQRPRWLIEDERLTVVSHEEVLPHHWLPTFNSHAIEAGLHRIPELGEHFVYFNDDMFLGRRLDRDAFFTSNGICRYFPGDAPVAPDEANEPLLGMDAAARNGRRLIESEFGVTVDRKLLHAPYALRRSTLDEVTARFADEVERTGRHRFRHPDDLSIAASLAHHWGHCTGKAIEGTLEVGYENVGSVRLPLFLDRVRLGRDLDVFCLNETEVSARRPADALRRVHRFLEHYLPLPSPWELTDAVPADR